jgi:hypothetical protein
MFQFSLSSTDCVLHDTQAIARWELQLLCGVSAFDHPRNRNHQFPGDLAHRPLRALAKHCLQF